MFDRRVAVVTGAGSGIGRALTVALTALGARVAASDVNAAGLAETVALTGAHGYEVDVSDRDAVYAHAEAVRTDLGPASFVINNAGVALKGTVSEMTDEDLRWVLDTNFWGVVHGTRAFLPQLTATRGHLTNISSVFGLIGVPTQSAYNAAKFAVRGFTEAIRQELHPQVGVTCVHPGGIRTNIARNGRTSNPAEADDFARALDRVARTTPDQAAATIINGIRRNRPRVLIGADAHAIDRLARLLGPAYQPLTRRLFR
ncbi:SDR family NAD(P)-dependent oxidoreductase [Actinokineospora inagensis]|uniref:SDR family NAD(P)-dependent oxidoreductase n=1 Tax=Actinokineospora inagensis TaxID=103730 RepID=UPI00041D257B|nr:SDR family NAD(P)-dependent oxidoreductase [Actinokineospora inagensis]